VWSLIFHFFYNLDKNRLLTAEKIQQSAI